MKLEITKTKFKNSLDRIAKALPLNSPLPSLEGILIKINESNITLLASNGTLSIKDIIEISPDVKVNEPGEILVPGRLFKEVISKQNGVISLEADDSHIHITSNGFKTDINLLNINDYPTISFDVFGKEVGIDSKILKDAIKNVSFAAAEGDKRVILNGVNLKAIDGKLKVSATNSYRLAQQTCDLNSNSEFDITILSKNLKDFLPSDVKGEIILKVDDSKIITEVGTTVTSSKLIDSDYPLVDKLIPQEFKHEILITSTEINNILDKVTVMSEDTKKVVKLILTEDELTLLSKKREIGTSEIKTTNFKYSGDPFEIAFNGQFLKDATSKFNGDIKILFISEYKPFIIKSINDDSITQLILPHKSF